MPKVTRFNDPQYFIKVPSRFATVNQVAKSPYEVLGNVNVPLTKIVMDIDVAESLITIIRGVEVYSKFFSIDLEQVIITEVEPLNRGLGITYSQKEIVGPDVRFKANTLDFFASTNEKAARWSMESSNMESLKRCIHAMHFLARQNGLTILDIGIETAMWPKGRNDYLFLGF